MNFHPLAPVSRTFRHFVVVVAADVSSGCLRRVVKLDYFVLAHTYYTQVLQQDNFIIFTSGRL